MGNDCSYDLAKPLTDPIDERSLCRAKFTYYNGEWVWNADLSRGVLLDPVEALQADPFRQAPAAQPSHDALMAYLNEQFSSLGNSIASLNTIMNSGFAAIDTCFTSLEERVTAIENRQNSMDISLIAFHGEWRQSLGTLANDEDEDEEDGDEP